MATYNNLPKLVKSWLLIISNQSLIMPIEINGFIDYISDHRLNLLNTQDNFNLPAAMVSFAECAVIY